MRCSKSTETSKMNCWSLTLTIESLKLHQRWMNVKMVKCLLATSFLRKRERNDLAAKYDSFHHHLSPIISLYISITFIDWIAYFSSLFVVHTPEKLCRDLKRSLFLPFTQVFAWYRSSYAQLLLFMSGFAFLLCSNSDSPVFTVFLCSCKLSLLFLEFPHVLTVKFFW